MAHATGKPNEHMPVPIRADLSHLTERERKLLTLLASATRLVNGVALEQMRQNLEETNDVFDRMRAPNFYPEGVTREQIEAYLQVHPENRKELFNPCTVVVKDGERFTAVPYSTYYADTFEKLAVLLEEAVGLTDNASFKTFLASKAQAFRTNQYRESDIDWIRIEGAPFELTIGPYENYQDKLFGVKRDVEAMLGVVLLKETAEAQAYQEQVVAFDAYLGARYGYTSAPTLTPMVVMDEVLAAGLSWYSYVPMAYNLPNDMDIHREVGTKKVFARNVIDEKMTLVTMRIAERVLPPELFSKLETAIFMRFVVGHELSHGVSFHFNGDGFLELGSPLEEGKADVFGLLFFYFLAKQGVVNKEMADNVVVAHVTDGLRQIRFGVEEAHAVGTLVQYNWLMAHGAVRLVDGRLSFTPEGFQEVIEGLGDELYALSQTRDHGAAQAFVQKWGTVPEGIPELLATFEGIPVDIDPVFEV